jgi:hypothetical protein
MNPEHPDKETQAALGKALAAMPDLPEERLLEGKVSQAPQ